MTVAELDALLSTTDLGRTPRRVDFTVTSTDGNAPEHLRTQHVTYRPRADGGFAEDLVYRNLHPMLAKRLDLWRLANFRLERLPSAEDVYLFHGVAHENPKDHRLFALAEVRDLTVVPDADRHTDVPLAGADWACGSLAAMRQALAGFAPRERPVANRIVLYVRPPWRVPRETWPMLAESLAAAGRRSRAGEGGAPGAHPAAGRCAARLRAARRGRGRRRRDGARAAAR